MKGYVICAAVSVWLAVGCGGTADRAWQDCDAARIRSTIGVLCSDSLEGRRAGSGNDMRAARFLAEELREAGCEPLWEDMLVPFYMGDAALANGMRDVLGGEWRDTTCNVVAVIPSGCPDADKVLLGAHFDHMGRFKRDSRGRYKAGDLLRGANDNASGAAAVVEIARLLRPHAAGFKRDLVVALFGAEELGIVGSRHLERMLRDSSVTLGHMVNLEMLGRMRGDTLSLEGELLSPVSEVAARVPRPDSLRVAVSPDFSMGSDHAAFAMKMIPVSLFATTDVSTLHTTADTPESLDMRGMERAVNYIARYVYELLSADELPPLREEV